MKYKIGLIIGRFQPFHFGHVYLLQQALIDCEKIIIGIGSSNVHDIANPYSYDVRKKMIDAFVHQENLNNRILNVIPIPDIPDDDEWLKECLKLVSEFDVVIGDNEWVNGIFENAGYTVLRIGHYKRDLYQGVRIRALMKENKDWCDRVPKYIKKIIERTVG